MATFKSTQLLDQLRNTTEKLITVATQEFQPLAPEQLLWKPSEKEWNIVECLDHINIGVEHYVLEIDKQFVKGNTGQFIPEFRSGRMGNYFVKMITPTESGEIKSKMGTMKKFENFSIARDNPHLTIDKFIEYQQKLLKQLEESGSVNLEKVRVKSAIGSLIMFRLGDAFRFIIGHNHRHIIQAQNVLKRHAQKAA
ncbi:MAG: DinB family protein [Bacteroidota bacterium]